MRVLLVTQFWPGDADPDYGVFVAQIAAELERLGNTVDVAAIDRRGAGRRGDAKLLRDALRGAAGRRPDVVFAHFLLPAGLAAALASLPRRVPLVLMAHGQDVENARHSRAVRAATSFAVRRAHTTIFNSTFLRDRLPIAPRRSEIIDCGVDLERFRGGDQAAARAALGLADCEGPVFLFAGSLIGRKNVVRLREAFEQLGRGTLVVVGEGELRPELQGEPRVHMAGRVPHDAMARYMTAADVLTLPSLSEPLGQVLLEAMASERSVVATRIGGPPEFVTPEAGALVDPLSVASIRSGLEHAASLGAPNPAARAAAAGHDVRRQAVRMQEVLLHAATSGE